ncbi:MAG: hypothetical protein WA261_07130 [Candidatus Sulfotelmatobacter sp.]
MVRHVAAIGMGFFLFVAVCVMVAQNPGQSLPEDPSVRIPSPSQSQRMNAFEHAWPLDVGAGSSYAPNPHGAEFAVYQNNFSRQKDSNTILAKYLNPPSSNRKPAYSPADAGNLMDRAVHAASRTFVTRDEAGRGKINTSYFLRTFTAVVADTASRPYWRRSVGEPFSDFGSSVGNSAGMNVLHEFEPSLQQALKSHAPRFVSRIVQHVGH